MSAVVKDFVGAFEVTPEDVDCPECGANYYGGHYSVVWEVTRYEDGSVYVEQYFTCPGGAPAGSPVLVRGCGPTHVEFGFDARGEQVA